MRPLGLDLRPSPVCRRSPTADPRSSPLANRTREEKKLRNADEGGGESDPPPSLRAHLLEEWHGWRSGQLRSWLLPGACRALAAYRAAKREHDSRAESRRASHCALTGIEKTVSFSPRLSNRYSVNVRDSYAAKARDSFVASSHANARDSFMRQASAEAPGGQQRSGSPTPLEPSRSAGMVATISEDPSGKWEEEEEKREAATAIQSIARGKTTRKLQLLTPASAEPAQESPA